MVVCGDAELLGVGSLGLRGSWRSVAAGAGFYLGSRVARGPDVKHASIQPTLGSLHSAGVSRAPVACRGSPAGGAWPREAGQVIPYVREETV